MWRPRIGRPGGKLPHLPRGSPPARLALGCQPREVKALTSARLAGVGLLEHTTGGSAHECHTDDLGGGVLRMPWLPPQAQVGKSPRYRERGDLVSFGSCSGMNGAESSRLSYVTVRGSHVVVTVMLHLWVKWQVGPRPRREASRGLHLLCRQAVIFSRADETL